MSQPDDLLREAVALARMAQMFRRVGGVMPGVKEMLDSLVSDADAFLAKFDAAKRESCQGMNCGSTDGLTHSPECYAEHAMTVDGIPNLLRKAIARAWCNPMNAQKEMDADIVEAAVAEVLTALAASGRQDGA